MLVVASGGAIAYLNATTTREQLDKALTDRAATIATALDTEKIAQLTGKPSDTSLAVYQELQTKLRLLKQNNTDARSIYVTRIHSGGVYFAVDSEVASSKYHSPPGKIYANASNFLKGMFSITTPGVEGPLGDGNGSSWVSGLAPVVDLHTGRAVAVVGIDSNANVYNQAILASAATPLLVSVVFIVVLAIYEWNRHRQQRELKARSELMSIASHELRTPITGMRWAAESMLHIQPQGPMQTMAKAMYDSVLNLQAGTEDILQLTRLQKNPKLQMAPTNLTQLVGEICNTQRILAGQKRVLINMDQTWPQSLVITCDPVRMKQVFHNLVSNAVKYTKPSTAVVVQYQLSGRQHKITIADQGIGIPKDEQSRVFAGFYRASNAKASGESGTGLGLYLVKTIVEQHHGKISFVTEENKGTTFTVILPAERTR